MTDLKARFVCICLGIFAFLLVSFLVRRRRVYNVYAITWFMISLVFLATGIFSNFAATVADFLGIYSPTTAIFSLAIGGILIMLLHLSIIVTEQHKELKRLEKERALAGVLNGTPPQHRMQGPTAT